MRKFLVTVFGSFFYTGFFPFAPATFACLVWLLLFLFMPGGWVLSHPFLALPMIPLAIFLSGKMEGRYGRDASPIVIDEFVGMQISLLAIRPSVTVGVAAFVLFRIFDVFKPFPIGASQRLKGGLGVVMDDIIAGVYTRFIILIMFAILHLG